MFKCLYLLIILLASSPSQGASLHKNLFLMGSFLNLYGEASNQEVLDQFYESLAEELNQYERKISTWNKNSDVSQFNKSTNNWIPINHLVYQTFKIARECSAITDEHFHPGLGSIIEMWGVRNKIMVPEKRDLRKVLQEIQNTQIDFDPSLSKVRKNSKAWKFEEGGIAKGVAIDLIKESAKRFKIKKLRIQFSGQIYESDEQDVLIPNPLNNKQIILTVKIKNSSISTTNNLNQSYSKNGKKYGHIINPKTGMLYIADNSSLIAVHPDGAMADCLSTGIFSLSRDEERFSQWVSAHPDVQFLNIKVSNNKIIVFSTCELSKKITVTSREIEIKNNCL